MTRVLNKMNGLMEVSDTQAAAALLGMNAGVCSDIFTSCDMAAYVQEMMQQTEQQKHTGARDLSEESDDSSVNSDASDEEALGDTAAESTIAEDCPFEHSIGRSENCKLYKVDNGEKYIPVPYASLYRNRGEGLKALNRYECCTQVSIMTRAKSKKKSKQEGRTPSKSFEFGNDFALQ